MVNLGTGDFAWILIKSPRQNHRMYEHVEDFPRWALDQQRPGFQLEIFQDALNPNPWICAMLQAIGYGLSTGSVITSCPRTDKIMLDVLPSPGNRFSMIFLIPSRFNTPSMGTQMKSNPIVKQCLTFGGWDFHWYFMFQWNIDVAPVGVSENGDTWPFGWYGIPFQTAIVHRENMGNTNQFLCFFFFYFPHIFRLSHVMTRTNLTVCRVDDNDRFGRDDRLHFDQLIRLGSAGGSWWSTYFLSANGGLLGNKHI